MSTTVRVNRETHRKIREIAQYRQMRIIDLMDEMLWGYQAAHLHRLPIEMRTEIVVELSKARSNENR